MKRKPKMFVVPGRNGWWDVVTERKARTPGKPPIRKILSQDLTDFEDALAVSRGELPIDG